MVGNDRNERMMGMNIDKWRWESMVGNGVNECGECECMVENEVSE